MRLVLLVVLGVCGAAAAQPNAPRPPPTPTPPPQHHRFEEVELGAGVQRPTAGAIVTRRPTRFRSLLKVRASFAPELHESADALR